MAKQGPWRRTVRWCDRVLVGAFMGTAAFVTERIVARNTRRTTRPNSSSLD